MTVGMSSVLTDTDFGRRVMAAAGVQPCKFESWVIGPNGESFPDPAPGVPLREGYCREAREPEYHDPLTPEGFVALWDGLVSKGYDPSYEYQRGVLEPHAWTMFVADEDGETVHVCEWNSENNGLALLEAAAQALGVSRG